MNTRSTLTWLVLSFSEDTNLCSDSNQPYNCAHKCWKWYEMHYSNIMTMVSSKLYTTYIITTTIWENLKVKCTNASCNLLSTTLLDWDDSTEVEVLKWATSILWYMFNVIRNMHAVCPHIDLWGSIKFRIGHSRSNQQENKAATMSLSYHANNNTKANGWGAWTRSWIRLDQA